MKLEELKPNPRNPRTISDSRLEALKLSLVKFGDLSGIVFNRTTQQLVGGHQRVRIFREANGAKVVIAEKKDKADAQGTVAVGVVRGDFGEFSYREVEWSAETEALANLAANKHGGEFDFDEVGKILKELDGLAPLNLTGFSEEELDALIPKDNHVDASRTPDAPPHQAVAPQSFIIYLTFKTSENLREALALLTNGSRTSLVAGAKFAHVNGDGPACPDDPQTVLEMLRERLKGEA